MIDNNGHHNGNGHHQAVNGKAAEAMQRLMPSSNLSRQDVRVLIDNAQRNIDPFLASPQMAADVIEVLRSVAGDPGSRQRVRAAEVLTKAIAAAVDQQIKLAELVDKTRRLDGGEPTENVRVFDVRIPEARMRLED